MFHSSENTNSLRIAAIFIHSLKQNWVSIDLAKITTADILSAAKF